MLIERHCCQEANFWLKDTSVLKAILHQKPLQETSTRTRGEMEAGGGCEVRGIESFRMKEIRECV